jgi:hypothetical protein
MAKFVIEFDSVEKTVSVTKDGEPVDNVKRVYIGEDWETKGKFGIDITTKAEDDENKITTYQTMTAEQRATAAAEISKRFSP